MDLMPLCDLQLVTCDSPAGKLGVTVCYDLRFPEMYQLLAWHLGAQIMLVPSAFTVATGTCSFLSAIEQISLTAAKKCMAASKGQAMHIVLLLHQLHAVHASC